MVRGKVERHRTVTQLILWRAFMTRSPENVVNTRNLSALAMTVRILYHKEILNKAKNLSNFKFCINQFLGIV